MVNPIPMEKDVLNKIKALTLQAKEKGSKNLKVSVSSGGSTALSRLIKTKEQGEQFMKMLKALA